MIQQIDFHARIGRAAAAERSISSQSNAGFLIEMERLSKGGDMKPLDKTEEEQNTKAQDTGAQDAAKEGTGATPRNALGVAFIEGAGPTPEEQAKINEICAQFVDRTSRQDIKEMWAKLREAGVAPDQIAERRGISLQISAQVARPEDEKERGQRIEQRHGLFAREFENRERDRRIDEQFAQFSERARSFRRDRDRDS